jgi:hypothetical protein
LGLLDIKIRSERTGGVLVIAKYPIQNQFGAPLHARFALVRRRPQDVFFLEPFLERDVQVAQLVSEFRLRPALVTGVFAILFATVLKFL